MTNEEYLNKKFPQACGPYDDAKVDYLLDMVEWMQKCLCNTYMLTTPYCVVANCIDEQDNELSGRGSCLLEAIENAQKEMGE